MHRRLQRCKPLTVPSKKSPHLRTCCTPWFARRSARSVAGIARMPSHPVPLHVVTGDQLVQAPPQVLVLHRLAVSGEPAARLPGVNPLADAVLDVLTIRINGHRGSSLEQGQRLYHGGELPMRLFVVCGSPPKSSRSCSPQRNHAPPIHRHQGCPCRRRLCHARLVRCSWCAIVAGMGLSHGASPGVTAAALPAFAALRCLRAGPNQAHAAHALDCNEDVQRPEDRPPLRAGPLDPRPPLEQSRRAPRRPPAAKATEDDSRLSKHRPIRAAASSQ